MALLSSELCRSCCLTREISLICLFLANQYLPLYNERKPWDRKYLLFEVLKVLAVALLMTCELGGGLVESCLTQELGCKLLLRMISVQEWSRSTDLFMCEMPSYCLLVDNSLYLSCARYWIPRAIWHYIHIFNIYIFLSQVQSNIFEFPTILSIGMSLIELQKLSTARNIKNRGVVKMCRKGLTRPKLPLAK